MSNVLPMPWRLGISNNVAITASSTQGAAFGPLTQAIMISATSDCHIAEGTNPTAAVSGAGSTLVRSAYPPLIFRVMPGEKIAVIQDTASGTLFVTELTT